MEEMKFLVTPEDVFDVFRKPHGKFRKITSER